MTNRSPAEVSLYLGLATAIATFTAAAVALGLLQCERGRDRAVSVGVMLLATIGIAAALITVARSRTSGLGNVLIGAGIMAGAAFVLARAMRLVFTTNISRKPNERPGAASHGSTTQRLPVTWSGTWKPDAESANLTAKTGQVEAVLRRPLWATTAAFLLIAVAATAGSAPDMRDFLNSLLRSRPVGQAQVPPRPQGQVPTRPDSAPARTLSRHYQRLNEGNYDGAFALFASGYRAANPGWSAMVRASKPQINVTSIGPTTLGRRQARVAVRFYGRDRRNAPGSDQQCRRFEGRARMVKQGEHWRYDPAPGAYVATVIPANNSNCPSEGPVTLAAPA